MAISLVFHAAVFLAVGLIAPKPGPRIVPDNTPVTIILLPPIPHERVHRSRPKPADGARQPQGGDTKRPLVIHAAKNVRHDAPPSPLPAPALPGPPTPASGIGTSHAPGPLPYEDTGTGVRAFLRGTVGCDYGESSHLTAEEKARCASRFADMEKKASAFSATPGEKLGGFMAEAAANARRRDAHDQSVPMTQPITRGGDLPPEAIHHFKY